MFRLAKTELTHGDLCELQATCNTAGWDVIVAATNAHIDLLTKRMAARGFVRLSEVTYLQGEIAGLAKLLRKIDQWRRTPIVK